MESFLFNNLIPEKQQKPKKQIDKKKLKKIIIIASVVLIIFLMIILYVNNASIRNFFDKYIFRKEVYENNLDTIHLSEDEYNYSYAFGNRIVVLRENNLDIYNSSAKKEKTLNIEVKNPIFDANSKYLAIAEKDGQKIYLISDNNIIWQQNIDGDIISISVNKNGYMSVVVGNTSYKTEIIVYDNQGNKLFSKFLGSSYAIDTEISPDNKCLAIAEANFSGTVIQSNIKIIPVEKAKEGKYDEDNYMAESNKLITNIEYHDKNKLICMFDDSIHVIENNNDTELMKYDCNNILFLDINLDSHIAQIERTSSGLNANSQIKFRNTNNNNTSSYEIGGIPKSIYSYKDVTAVNLGTEAVFVKTNGWLSKRYKSSQEIQNIILSNSIAGIVYKNKIEIVKL